MKRFFTYALAVLLALSTSCNKEEKVLLDGLRDTLSEIEGQADGMGLPDAVVPESEAETGYALSLNKVKCSVDAGSVVAVHYSLPEPSTVSVDVVGGLSVQVNASSDTEGDIIVTAPDPASPATIYVTAVSKSRKQTTGKVEAMVRDPYTDATRTCVNLLGYYNLKPQWCTAENFQKLADAGLKSVTVETEDYNYRDQMDLAHQAGLKTLPIIGWLTGRYERDPENYKGLDEYVAYLSQHPSTMAYHMCDEPSTRDIPSLLFRKQKVESLDPNHPVYINLNPDGSITALGVDNYHDYIEAFARDCKCKLISFDMYPILPEGQVMTHWHRCLRDVSEVSRQYGVPFWAFAASCWINNEGAVSVRGIPSTENLRLQVYTDLAYGAQVVQYFTIQQYGGTTLAPFMADGTWTIAYEFLKEASQQVQKRGFVFDGCSVHKVRFTAQASVWGNPLCSSDLPSAIGYLNTSSTALVSFLENRGNEYIAIVNQSYTGKITASVTFNEMAYTIERDGTFTEHDPGSEEFTIDEGDLMVIKIR